MKTLTELLSRALNTEKHLLGSVRDAVEEWISGQGENTTSKELVQMIVDEGLYTLQVPVFATSHESGYLLYLTKGTVVVLVGSVFKDKVLFYTIHNEGLFRLDADTFKLVTKRVDN